MFPLLYYSSNSKGALISSTLGLRLPSHRRRALADARQLRQLDLRIEIEIRALAQGRHGERGLEVPGDVSTIGYDNTFISSLHSVSLTTIDQPRLEMGRLAVDLMSQRIDGERTDAVRRTLDPALIVRGSTARR